MHTHVSWDEQYTPLNALQKPHVVTKNVIIHVLSSIIITCVRNVNVMFLPLCVRSDCRIILKKNCWQMLTKVFTRWDVSLATTDYVGAELHHEVAASIFKQIFHYSRKGNFTNFADNLKKLVSSFYLLRYNQIKHSNKHINMSRTYQARTCTYGSPVKVRAQSKYK